jgi:hypothetical protein
MRKHDMPTNYSASGIAGKSSEATPTDEVLKPENTIGNDPGALPQSTVLQAFLFAV